MIIDINSIQKDSEFKSDREFVKFEPVNNNYDFINAIMNQIIKDFGIPKSILDDSMSSTPTRYFR